MANGESSSDGLGPLVLAAGAVVLVLGMMAGIATLKPLEFKPVPAMHCETEECAHEGAPPVSGEHEAPPPASGAHEPKPQGE